MPLGAAADGTPRLQLVSLPERGVDWSRTDAYRDAARSAQYAAAQGESDFALMTGDVARVLNEIALTKDPAHRLRLAEQARAQLAEWPARHYGYRARDVREIAALLDETISRTPRRGRRQPGRCQLRREHRAARARAIAAGAHRGRGRRAGAVGRRDWRTCRRTASRCSGTPSRSSTRRRARIATPGLKRARDFARGAPRPRARGRSALHRPRAEPDGAGRCIRRPCRRAGRRAGHCTSRSAGRAARSPAARRCRLAHRSRSRRSSTRRAGFGSHATAGA